HEGLGHALTALLTGTPSGVLSTMAWSSPYDTTRLVAAAGTLVNLAEALMFWLALRGARKASPQTRLFLFAGCTFNLFTGSGYFFFSGVSNFGDWAQVVAGLHPHWMWMVLLTVGGAIAYYFSMRAMGGALVRYMGIPREDKPRMKWLTWNLYFSVLVLSVAAGLMNPLGIKVVLESAVAASAGGNAGLLWLRYYVPKGAAPQRSGDGVARSYAWIGTTAVLLLPYIFVLGRGVALHR
ncbi:MAG TPA: hypothetical protein VNK23_06075, partial [Candidatus Dormibacteraeota bacterium]|nr:hypothetical protein [Candidatus Dormibacteraeota bacterium]